MLIAQIIGTVVCTIKDKSYSGRRLVVVQPLDLCLKPQGDPYIAVDVVHAGLGDTVLVVTEGEAAWEILETTEIPIMSVVAAIVDHVELVGEF